MTLERNAPGMGPGEKIPAAAALTLSALSLEPSGLNRQKQQQTQQPLPEPTPQEEDVAVISAVEPHRAAEVLLEAKRPWKPKRLMNQKKDDDLVPEETATSAGESQ